MVFHITNLGIGCVGTHHFTVGQIEGILHIPSGVIGQKVSRFKIVIVLFYFRTASNGLAQPDKNIGNLVNNAVDGMHLPLG